MGAEIIDRGIARLPFGGYLFFWSEDDSGIVYSFDVSDSSDVKFIQRVFSNANLLLKNMRTHPQSLEIETEEKEERKKGTDEVSEFISGTSDSVHGGDSASGEVPEGVSGGGQGKPSQSHALPQQQEAGSMEEGTALPSGTPHLSPDASPQGEGESGATDRSKPERASEGGSSEDGACPKSSECSSHLIGEGGDAPMDRQVSIGEGTGSPHSHSDLTDISSPEDILEEILREESELGVTRESSTVPSPGGAIEGEAPVPEREVSPSLSFKELRRIMHRGQELPSMHPRYDFGGIFADLESCGIPPRELVNRARRVFARLVSEYGEGSEGPRWDYRKVSTRIASYQSWKVSDRKKEVGRPVIAVLPDVSGSMARFANQVLTLSRALMILGVPGCEVIAVVQSNGRPIQLWVNNQKVEEYDYDQWSSADEVFHWYSDVFCRYNVKIVILAADWDGAWLYAMFAEDLKDIKKIYWIDPSMSYRVYPVLSSKSYFMQIGRWRGLRQLSDQAMRKIMYVYGCRDANEFLSGLQLCIDRRYGVQRER
jgi:hypothetical protein